MKARPSPVGTESAGVAQLVEHDVANVVVVGSNPITRSCAMRLTLASLARSCLTPRSPTFPKTLPPDAAAAGSGEEEATRAAGALEVKVDTRSTCERHVTVTVPRDGHRAVFRQGVQRVDAARHRCRDFGRAARRGSWSRPAFARTIGEQGQERTVDGQPRAGERGRRSWRPSASRTSIWKRWSCPTRGR